MIVKMLNYLDSTIIYNVVMWLLHRFCIGKCVKRWQHASKSIFFFQNNWFVLSKFCLWLNNKNKHANAHVTKIRQEKVSHIIFWYYVSRCCRCFAHKSRICHHCNQYQGYYQCRNFCIWNFTQLVLKQ